MNCPNDPDCYWVEPGRLLAGEYPGDEDDDIARERLGALLDAGVRTFVDLTEAGELESYEAPLMAEADARGIAVRYHRHQIRDLDVTDRPGMCAILDVIDDAIAQGAPVYVHCWGGIGRTGTVVGCWLVERGRTGDQALVDIVLLRDGTRKRQTMSPQMPAQHDFVKQWTRRDR